MKNILHSLLILALATPVLMASDDVGNRGLDMEAPTKGASSILDLVFLGAKVVGAIAIIWGIVELLVEKDQGGQQGKKVSGSMKLVGGVLLLLVASVVQWAMGDVDKNCSGGSMILEGHQCQNF